MAIGMPGWPLLAFWTASIDGVRMVSMLRGSMSTFATDSVVLMAAGYPCTGSDTVPPAMDSARTPDERFAALPGFPFPPHYREWEGLRLAHIDEGDRAHPPVVFFHGEPTWSFLWRKVMPPVLEAGYRCIAPDLPGFGRSDKPTDIE